MSKEYGVTPKGYYIGTGYMGWIPWYERYMLFATEKEYLEYIGVEEDSNETY